jgi:2-dehydropantoate 2-reductase
MPVEGQHQALTDVLAVLKSSKIPAVAQENFAAKNVHASSFLMVFLAVLELSDWQFKRLSANKVLLKTMINAQQEVFAALHAEYGTKPNFALTCLKTWMMPIILNVAQHIAPLNMEVYMKAHFLKVREQTLMLLQAYEQRAQQHQVSHEALSGLIKQLQAK